jgi:hypothetical protein
VDTIDVAAGNNDEDVWEWAFNSPGKIDVLIMDSFLE